MGEKLLAGQRRRLRAEPLPVTDHPHDIGFLVTKRKRKQQRSLSKTFSKLSNRKLLNIKSSALDDSSCFDNELMMGAQDDCDNNRPNRTFSAPKPKIMKSSYFERAKDSRTITNKWCLLSGFAMIMMLNTLISSNPLQTSAYSMTNFELNRMANKTQKLNFDLKSSNDYDGDDGDQQPESSNISPATIPPQVSTIGTIKSSPGVDTNIGASSDTNLMKLPIVINGPVKQALSLSESQVASVQTPWLPVEQMLASDSKKKKKMKMMKKKKKMEKKHKEWKKGKKHKKKKYESKKKKGGMEKKKKGKKEKKKWGMEKKGHKKKGNFKKKKWGKKKKMKKGQKKGKKGHKMMKDKGHKKKGFKKVYHKEEWGKKKKWHDLKREKKWNAKQKKWKKKWHQEKGKKYKGKHMKKYHKKNKHGKKYKKEKKSKWKKHKGSKFKKGHKKKKEEYSKKKEGGKKKKMKKMKKEMKKKKKG